MQRSRRWNASILAGLGLGVGVLLLGGCPFEPRTPEPPCTPGVDVGCSTPVELVDPTTAAIARDNIVKALKKRGFDGPNLDFNYKESLEPGFVYVPDADALAASSNRECQPYFSSWGRDREVQFMRIVLQEGTSAVAIPDTVDLQVTSFVLDAQFPDVERYNLDYVLSLKYAASASTARVVQCYAGKALWTFTGRARNHFLLQRWEDTESLRDASCPGGTAPGSVGILKALDGPCP